MASSARGRLSDDEINDDDLSIPRASMNKMIKQLLPNVRVANESRELILNCCREFILLLSSEANVVCNNQSKKTINADHVVSALERLGFADYCVNVQDVARKCKDVKNKRRKQSTRLENLGIPEEELLRQQQELFARARQEQMLADQQQLQQLQADAMMHEAVQIPVDTDDDEDYS